MKLLRLISPVIGAIVASLLALIGVAFIFAHSLDRNAVAAEKRLLSSILNRIPMGLVSLAEDNAWWDEAVDHLVLVEDQEWLRTTIGDTVIEDGIVILRADNSVLYHYSKKRYPLPVKEALANGLETAFASLQPINEAVSVSTHGYVMVAGRVFAVGASMVQPSGGKEFDPPLSNRRRPMIFFYHEIDDNQLREISEDVGLHDLTFTSTDTEGDGTLMFFNIARKPVGKFVWTPKKPGSELLANLQWPVTIFLIIVFWAIFSFIRRAQSLVRELEQADEAKSAFLASMSHEVRTPLNAIIGFAEMLSLELQDTADKTKTEEYLDIIKTSGEHMLTIINDILDISKLDAGKMKVFAEKMDPMEVISQSMRMLEHTARDCSVRLVSDLEAASITSDERIIRQILINILSNAIKFTGAGGQVSVHSEKRPSGYKIVVSDTGIGMSQDEIEVALQSFGQVAGREREEIRGTGLGLPLVNRFMTLIGGTMTIRSAPGHGTSITLDFPQSPPTATGAKPVSNPLV